MKLRHLLIAATFAVAPLPALAAGMLPTPASQPGEAAGPYPTLVIRGATIITGNGGPP